LKVNIWTRKEQKVKSSRSLIYMNLGEVEILNATYMTRKSNPTK